MDTDLHARGRAALRAVGDHAGTFHPKRGGQPERSDLLLFLADILHGLDSRSIGDVSLPFLCAQASVVKAKQEAAERDTAEKVLRELVTHLSYKEDPGQASSSLPPITRHLHGAAREELLERARAVLDGPQLNLVDRGAKGIPLVAPATEMSRAWPNPVKP
jgi:hypothetical protein